MLAYQMPTTASEQSFGDLAATDSPSTTISTTTPPTSNTPNAKTLRRSSRIMDTLGLTLRPGYQYRAPNHEIGRAAEKKEAAAQAKGKTSRVYDEFKPGDRFAAWRKSSVRIARNNERRAMGRGKKGKK